MAFDFYDLLYMGYTGEYQLVSALYRNGLDAVRPPADMGIDVVSLNLKDQLRGEGVASETFFFQVKSFVTTISLENEADEGDKTWRNTTDVFFKLKESELDLLCGDGNRALVCYVYNHANDALVNANEAPFMCFWLDGSMLSAIREEGAFFLYEGDSKYTLRVRLCQPDSPNAHWYASVVDCDGRLVSAGYLGTVDGTSELTCAPDKADHYSVKGFLDHARQKARE